MGDSDFLTAAEAAEALGVQRATLYAYVSRGLLRSEAGPRGQGRRYPAAEVEALRRRVSGQRDPAAVARGALAWGVPVLDSALTLIADGRLHYRGHDVVDLVRGGETLERVAALLWLGDLDAALPAVPAPALDAPGLVAAAAREGRPFERLLTCLPLATAGDPAAYDLRPASVVAAGARLLPLLATFAAGFSRTAGRAAGGGGRQSAPRRGAARPAGLEPEIAQESGHGRGGHAAAVLAQAWVAAPGGGADPAEAARLIDAALVLSADHELNASAFTARCAASARAPLAAVVLAGLATLSGSRHGGYSDRVEAFVAEAGQTAEGRRGEPAAWRAVLADRLRRGEEVPGFGHPLYPGGDPRGRVLLELAAAHQPRSPAVEAPLALAAAAHELLGEHPSLDFGLVALARALALPAGAPLALFAVGRAAGWVAHALEQYAEPGLIRPRARYVGPAPA